MQNITSLDLLNVLKSESKFLRKCSINMEEKVMVEWISGWAQGIIVAVIIATIIEMLLPEGSSKKYIKVVVGIYILFTIVSPVITKVTNKEFKLSDIIDLDEYIEAASSDNTYNELEKSNNENIKEVYIANKGYNADSIEVEVQDNDEYTINSITISVSKLDEKEENNNIEIVNEVEINVSTSTEKSKENEKEELSKKEKEELKEYLSSVYELPEDNIIIN